MNTTYARSTYVPIVTNTSLKPYKLTIRDIPLEQKPREKLLREGPAVLSIAELWAVVLNLGTKKEDIMSMSTRILREYGEKSITKETNPKKLAAELGIPIGKATQIVAAVELGKRLFERNPTGAKIIRTAQDVYEYTKNMWDLPKEHLRGIYLNSHYKVIHDEVIAIGTVDANIIHPREVFRPALEYAAAAVVLVHNHPSGNLEPSDDDIAITYQLMQASTLLGIDLVDHVIVSSQGFKSIIAINS
ncbi:DNA repair protein RadC [bacterium]|nr:DNA repair protein RadC [bacterium]